VTFAVLAHTGTCRDQLTDNNVLLQAEQRVNLTLDRSLGQDTGGLLEGSGRQEGLGCQRCLGDTHEGRAAGCQLEIGLASVDACLYLIVVILELEQVDDRTRQYLCVTCVLNLNLAHHLTNDNLNVLIVDVYALLTVNLLDFLDQVVMNGTRIAYAQDVVRAECAVVELLTLLDVLTILDTDAGGRSQLIRTGVAVFGVDDVYRLERSALGLLDVDTTRDLCQSCNLLGLACLEQFLDSGKTLGNIRTCDTTGKIGRASCRERV